MRRHSAAYRRRLRQDMIRILTHSREHWKKESVRMHQTVTRLSAIIDGLGPDVTMRVQDIRATFQKFAEDADAHLKRDRRELRRWRAKRI